MVLFGEGKGRLKKNLEWNLTPEEETELIEEYTQFAKEDEEAREIGRKLIDWEAYRKWLGVDKEDGGINEEAYKRYLKAKPQWEYTTKEWDDYLAFLLKETKVTVEIYLKTGKTLTGVILWFDNYHLGLSLEKGQEILVPKHSVLYYEVKGKGWI